MSGEKVASRSALNRNQFLFIHIDNLTIIGHVKGQFLKALLLLFLQAFSRREAGSTRLGWLRGCQRIDLNVVVRLSNHHPSYQDTVVSAVLLIASHRFRCPDRSWQWNSRWRELDDHC